MLRKLTVNFLQKYALLKAALAARLRFPNNAVASQQTPIKPTTSTTPAADAGTQAVATSTIASSPALKSATPGTRSTQRTPRTLGNFARRGPASPADFTQHPSASAAVHRTPPAEFQRYIETLECRFRDSDDDDPDREHFLALSDYFRRSRS